VVEGGRVSRGLHCRRRRRRGHLLRRDRRDVEHTLVELPKLVLEQAAGEGDRRYMARPSAVEHPIRAGAYSTREKTWKWHTTGSATFCAKFANKRRGRKRSPHAYKNPWKVG
jgi:hypothetical protein